jgi:RimJ/RimL family protein N-acetyltransferase
MTSMPPIETPRLTIRPFVMDDLPEVYQLLDVDLRQADIGSEPRSSLEERREWLRWCVLNYEQLALLYQPPYGDRAVVLKDSGRLIGSCGFVPCLMPFEQLPGFTSGDSPGARGLSTTELGLFYAISPAYQRRGYATEAARGMVYYAFQHLRLKRVIATTTYDNAASMGVMRRLGMHIESNPFPEPAWLQVVGTLENTL